MEKLSNGSIEIAVSSHGAELSSVVSNGREYLWQADPAFWKRHSPVLFPIVGSVWNGEFKVDTKVYRMSQHGFARDMDFELVSKTEDSVLYRLESNENTLACFPYEFVLEIGYRIENRRVFVLWTVKNPSDKDIYFQIGAHPAFYYPVYDESPNRGYMGFDNPDFTHIRLKEKGCADVDMEYETPLEDGLLPLDIHTFDIDTYIVEKSQLKEVIICDLDKKPYLKVTFDSPLVGLWSPPSKNAPFVCIEPWYGRCDRAGFVGEFKDRDHVNHLAPGETFHSEYVIEVM